MLELFKVRNLKPNGSYYPQDMFGQFVISSVENFHYGSI